jgi:uncharacterized protein YcaQ
MPKPLDLPALRRHAVARTLFAPTTLPRAISRLGFVQADPIRAPATAQDLTLRHRVKDYRAGDLGRRYARMAIEEDFFINHGILPRDTQRLMHPRRARTAWDTTKMRQAQAVLNFVRERGTVHPREVDAQFSHGKVSNWFGGTTNASTQLLDGMQYRGMLRIAGRAGGVRLYAAAPTVEPPDDPQQYMDALAEVVLGLYAPLPESTLKHLVSRLVYAAPQWMHLRKVTWTRLRDRVQYANVDGHSWYWPDGENPASKRHEPDDIVRLLAPFDPIVWDRTRFERLWGWAYRFEAYTPAPKRVRGYYALPLLWRDQIIGWGNLKWRHARLEAEIGYVAGKPPRDAAFKPALDDELQRVEVFLRGAPAAV